MSSAAVLTPMPGTPGTLSVESPASACTSTTLSGGTPNFSITSSRPIFFDFMASNMTTPGTHELHQVLVGGDDRDVAAGVDDLARVRRDEVVGLVALLLDAGDVEGLHRVADERELGDELVGRRRTVRLVVLVDLVAEVLAASVEDHRHVGRRLRRLRLAQELPQHGAEAVHGADGQAVGRARQGRERVEGAEDVARAVDEIDVAALDDGRRLAFRHRRDGGVLRLERGRRALRALDMGSARRGLGDLAWLMAREYRGSSPAGQQLGAAGPPALLCASFSALAPRRRAMTARIAARGRDGDGPCARRAGETCGRGRSGAGLAALDLEGVGTLVEEAEARVAHERVQRQRNARPPRPRRSATRPRRWSMRPVFSSTMRVAAIGSTKET